MTDRQNWAAKAVILTAPVAWSLVLLEKERCPAMLAQRIIKKQKRPS
jgi:hypothetical protein